MKTLYIAVITGCFVSLLGGCAHQPTCFEMYQDDQSRLACQQQAVQRYQAGAAMYNSSMQRMQRQAPAAPMPTQKQCTYSQLGNSIIQNCQ